VVSILITDFCMIQNSYYHNRYRLHDPQTGSEFTDLLEVNVLELPKTPDTASASDEALVAWLKFLKAKDKEEFDMLSQQNPDIRRAVERLADLSADQQARMEYEAHLRYVRDQATQEYGVREEGRLEGLAEGEEKGRAAGREEERKEFARKMLQHSFPLEQIIEMTGLTRQEIQEL